jgi:hypothetical protein
VLEQEKQVPNWINSGGHVPHPYIENSNRETAGRHRAVSWKTRMMIGSVLLMLPLAADRGEARDPDGRYANSPLKQWFDSLRSRVAPTQTAAPSATWIGNRKTGTTAFVSTAIGMTFPKMPSSPSRTG